ncbi:MAG TPA: parallel beta-helix domain-containing protein [Blastocatellia bacterium]|nr:parallel beta-helix domain-containing protein [Blastocatellia bacterium]
MTASAKQMPLDHSGSTSRTKPRRLWLRLILALFVVLVAGFIALGVWPAPAEFTGDEGTVGVATGGGGLKKDFPAMVIPADNMTTDPRNNERIALGRLLFFDPVLSGANDISCATCHHPDLGFSDGRGLSMGKGAKGLGPERAGGSVVKRGAPSLWNATFNHMQFWDGRAPDLEEQAKGPITSDIEMAENPDTLVGELKAIPEYAQKFDSAFGGANGSGVNFDNVVKAVAAFERRLTANNAPFDRFVAGDHNALTQEQLRGFNLFRSGRTRCFECHGMPTFANRDFKIIGVPEVDSSNPDYGRFDVTKGEGNKYAFKVPTLRNVVLNPPYMHNGKLKTLEEVIDFYAAGGGPGVGFKEPRVDDKIHSYSITAEEKQDLIAFMYALVDESNAPEFPDRVPSGLPVVPHIENAARALAVKHNTGSQKDLTAKRAPQTITVKDGESIQAAVDRAQAGDTIEVMPGVYREEVKIDLDNITMRGLPAGSLSQALMTGVGRPDQLPPPILDGEKKLSDGVIATGSNFVIENFQVRNYVANGVVAQHARNVTFRALQIHDTGLYGLYPVSCTGVTIERCVATGIADAALYVGQSRDIVVRDSEAYNNVTGIEIENSINAVVENNYVHDNTGGILVFVLPNNVSKVGRDCTVRNNRVINNNHVNFANPNSIVANVMPGTGILVMAADNTEVTANEIRGNDTFGVAVFSLEVAFPKGTAFDVGPTPENTFIHGNTFADNGRNPSENMTKEGIKGADLVWDLSGWSNKWKESNATSATPVLSASWPAFARRAEWRVLQFMQKYL